jgi:beta-lactamase regulating signal transducer with metallopeptidase domain
MSQQSLIFVDWLNSTAPLWWQCIAIAALQAGLVALVGLGLIRVCRRWSAPLRYGILTVLLLKFLIAPVLLVPSHTNDRLTVTLPWPDETSQPTVPMETKADALPSDTATPVPVAQTEGRVVLPPAPVQAAVDYEDPHVLSLISIAGWCWLLHLSGSVIVILGLTWQWLKLFWLVYRQSYQAQAPIRILCDDVKKKLGYRRPLKLRVSELAPAPIAFKLFVPTVVLPQITIDKLDHDDLAAVLAHEIAHLHRRDPLVNILQILLLGIWWFHPLYWMLMRQLRRTREECCDDMVLARGVTQDERYCQVLLDAARASLCATTGGAILGFGESAQSMHQRMQRIMSPRVRKVARIGLWSGLALLVLGLITMPMWRTGSSMDTPRPVTDSKYSPGLVESLAAGLKLQPYPRLVMDQKEEDAVGACITLSKLTRHTRNGVAQFDLPKTKAELVALQKTMATPFYAEYLLSKWHERQGHAQEARQFMQQALEHAPLVLVRTYQFMDGKPLARTSVGTLGVECRMKTAASSNSSKTLEFIDLVTDDRGRIYLPAYDTKIRCNGVQHPDGYEIETGRHGYLECHARYNLLPTIYVWPKGSPRPFTPLPPSKFYHYNKAHQAKGLTHQIGVAKFSIDRCYRLDQDGTVCANDGRSPQTLAPDESVPAFPEAHASLDQAAIHFQRNTMAGHEILEVRLFDHRSRGLLTQYHAPGAWSYTDPDTILMKSFGRPLPERVDVWFWVTKFSTEDKKQTVLPQVGATAEFLDYHAELTHIHSGRRGYNSRNGSITFNPPAKSDESQCQVAFEITPKQTSPQGQYAFILAFDKDGKRYKSEYVIYPRNKRIVCTFPIALTDLDHFELLPIGEESCFFFDGVRLPTRSNPTLAEQWEVVIPTHGQTGSFVSPHTLPAHMTVTVLPGQTSISTSTRGHGLITQRTWRYGDKERNPDTHSTLVSEMSGLSPRMLQTEITPLDRDNQPLVDKPGSGPGTLTYQSFPISSSDIHAIRVKLSWSGK